MNALLSIETSHVAWLTSEVERLDTQLHPAPRSIVAERMKIVLAALPSQDKGASEELRAQAYVYALEGVPLHILDEVVRDVLQGRISELSPVFAPTPPQLARICRERTDLLLDLRSRRQSEARNEDCRALPEPVMSPEVAGRIAAKADAFIAKIDRHIRDSLDREQSDGVRACLQGIADQARERQKAK